VDHAREKGASTVGCMTNGYWAADMTRARKMIREFQRAGLSTLGLSADEFHQECIPLASVKNAFRASSEAGLNIVLKCAVTRKTRRLTDVLQSFGDLVLNTTVTVQEIACVPEGRATREVPDGEWLFSRKLQREGCPTRDMVAILPDGDAYPCCGTGWMKRLQLGNARKTPVAALIEQNTTRALLNAIRDCGPSFFLPYFAETSRPLPKQGYISLCHLCTRVLTHPDAGRVLEAALRDYRARTVDKLMAGLLKPGEYRRGQKSGKAASRNN